MKKFVGFYYRCSFKVCLWAFLSLIGLTVLSSSAFAVTNTPACDILWGFYLYGIKRHCNNHQIYRFWWRCCNPIYYKWYAGGRHWLVYDDIFRVTILIGLRLLWGVYSLHHVTSVTIPDSVTSIGSVRF